MIIKIAIMIKHDAWRNSALIFLFRMVGEIFQVFLFPMLGEIVLVFVSDARLNNTVISVSDAR